MIRKVTTIEYGAVIRIVWRFLGVPLFIIERPATINELDNLPRVRK